MDQTYCSIFDISVRYSSNIDQVLFSIPILNAIMFLAKALANIKPSSKYLTISDACGCTCHVQDRGVCLVKNNNNWCGPIALKLGRHVGTRHPPINVFPCIIP